ncbi:MAG: histidine phosphatase family protein [Rubrivivax sp.]|nr:histidine phosphatase family protein [Rubrivivax sp.]
MPHPTRRTLLRTGLALPLASLPALACGQAPGAAVNALRTGGVVIAFRHALAPGTFDPPGFTLGQCSTQRNLNDDGRAQARRIGQWFQRQGLTPARVLSSPWCRCTETAQLAFGGAEAWPALGSPRGYAEQTNAEHLGLLRGALSEAARQPGRFDVWVTHMFVLAALVQENTSSGEGLVLRADGRGGVQVLARVAPA